MSCATAASILRVLNRERYEVLPIGITRTGQWVLMPDDPKALELHAGSGPEVAESLGDVILPMADSRREVVVVEPGEPPRSLGEVDVVFPVLHGPYGEDGTVQGLLEMAEMPYVGSGVPASAVGMDKQYMKLVLEGYGLAVGPYRVVAPKRWASDRAGVLKSLETLGLPVFVKPARGGSSLGIAKVERVEDLPAAIAEAQCHDPKVIVEKAIDGREIECAVLAGRGDSEPRTAQPGEIVVDGHGFYDFRSKYIDPSTVRLICPADLSEELTGEIRKASAAAFEALGCEGLARVDVFVDSSDRVVINEVNTMPGFTPYSMYPLMWERSGLPYVQLLDELLQLALERPIGLR